MFSQSTTKFLRSSLSGPFTKLSKGRKMNNVLCVLVLVATIAVVAGLPNKAYCNVASCPARSHTLCKYARGKISPRCDKFHSSGITRKERKEIINIHNKLRERVRSGKETRGLGGRPQPAAANLGPLKWDKTLAKIAQTWANQCIYDHDQCHVTMEFDVGQNIAYRSTSEPYDTTLTSLVEGWYDEVDRFDPRRVKPFTPSNEYTNHYTAMIWAKSTLVGCGAIRYNNLDSEGLNRTQLVCNYGPRGNWYGESVYEPRPYNSVHQVY